MKQTSVMINNEPGSSELEKLSTTTLKKGLLWTQRDKLFSRWKERYFVITKDYLNCFKKGTSKLSEMGEFLYKVKVGDAECVELLDKRGYLTICLSLPKDGKIYLRRTEGIREWHKLLKECQLDAIKKKRESGVFTEIDTENFWSRKQVTDSSSIEAWLQNRKKKAMLSSYSDSTPDINKVTSSRTQSPSKQKGPEITLSELSALYQNADDLDDMARPDNKPIETNLDLSADHKSNSLSSSNCSPENKVVVKMRKNLYGSKPDLNSGNKRRPKIINRLSLMSDIELPDFGNHQNAELKKPKGLLDSQSNDSGHHSMSTSASLSSSSSSKSKDSTSEELKDIGGSEVLHKTVVHIRESTILSEENEPVIDDHKSYRRSAYAHGLQITHV